MATLLLVVQHCRDMINDHGEMLSPLSVVLVSISCNQRPYSQGVEGILMWRLDIIDEMSGEPNKAGLEFIRLTQYDLIFYGC